MANGSAEPFRVLVADLRDIAIDLEAGGYSRTTLAMFQRDLRRVVPSALGATISFTLEQPVVRSLEMNLVDRTIDPAEIGSGLRLSLNPLRPSLEGSIVLYASTPAAFTDVDTDLVASFFPDQRHVDQSPTLPRESVSPSTADLQDFSLVNQALGLLLHRGYSLSEARDDIRERATHARTDLPGVAQILLDTFASRRGEVGKSALVLERPPSCPPEGPADSGAFASSLLLSRSRLSAERGAGIARHD